MLAAQGKTNISSSAIADIIGTNAWQIRKDFSYFGAFGKPGSGYDIDKLSKQISKILKINKGHKVALIGVGNLGSAVLAYKGFANYGFDLVVAFDSDPKRIGKKLGEVTIENISKINSLKKRNITVAILAVPESAAQQVTDTLVKTGIKGILNFSPCYLQVPKSVRIITIDIAIDLARLPYYIG